MTNKQEKAIIQHGKNLNAIFNTGIDPLTLCIKLRRIENRIHMHAINYCNGVMLYSAYNQAEKRALTAVNKLLNFRAQNVPVFINGDPRGYALKIKEDWIRNNHSIRLECDWGGYGLIAPEFNRDGYAC